MEKLTIIGWETTRYEVHYNGIVQSCPTEELAVALVNVLYQLNVCCIVRKIEKPIIEENY